MADLATLNATKIHFAEGSAPATPDAGEVVIYAKSDGVMYMKDDAGTETALGGGVDTDVLAKVSANDTTAGYLNGKLVAGSNITLTEGSDGGNETLTIASTASGSGASDPITEVFGAADTDYDATDIIGLTAMGSPDVEDADTTVPGHYYVKDTNVAFTFCGRMTTTPTEPWTAITKVNTSPVANYHVAGMFIGVASPGNMDLMAFRSDGSYPLRIERVTPGGYGSDIGGSRAFLQSPIWLAFRANSSTSFDYLWSTDGYIWRAMVAGRNPGITIASIGIGGKAENGSSPFAAAFPYLRIWNSALTMPGI